MPVTVILSKTISVPWRRVGGGFYVAVLLGDLCAQEFEAFDVEVDGALADGAAAGEGDAGAAAAG